MKKCISAALTILTALSSAVMAEPAPDGMERRLEALEKKVDSLTAAPGAAPARAGDDGFFLSSPDSGFRMRFRALVQADGRFFTGRGAASVPGTFLMRRVRPTLEGTLAKNVEFRITPDFGGGTTVLYDAYIDVGFCRFAKLRAGKFKPPVGLERLQSAGDTLFAERAFPTSLVPTRDTGVGLFGEFWGGALTYGVSLTNGVADGSMSDGDVNDSKDAAARVFAQPFMNGSNKALKGLGVGAAGSYTGDNTLLPSYKSPGQQTFFSYASGVAGDGVHGRFSPQGYYYYGPLGIMEEFARSVQVVNRPGARARLSDNAWQTSASWVVTGEDASFKGVAPRRAFDPASGNWGALQLAARIHSLRIDPNAFAAGWASRTTSSKRALAWAAGANWFLNREVKFMADYEHTRFKYGAPGGDRRDERVIFTRWQVSF